MLQVCRYPKRPKDQNPRKLELKVARSHQTTFFDITSWILSATGSQYSLNLNNILFMCVNVVPAYMSMFVYHMHAWCPGRLKEVFRSLKISVMYSCELSCGRLEQISGPVQE